MALLLISLLIAGGMIMRSRKNSNTVAVKIIVGFVSILAGLMVSTFVLDIGQLFINVAYPWNLLIAVPVSVGAIWLAYKGFMKLISPSKKIENAPLDMSVTRSKDDEKFPS